jgi:hypothetical protein
MAILRGRWRLWEIIGQTDRQTWICNQLDTDMDVTEHGTYPQRHSGKMTINVAKHADLKSV